MNGLHIYVGYAQSWDELPALKSQMAFCRRTSSLLGPANPRKLFTPLPVGLRVVGNWRHPFARDYRADRPAATRTVLRCREKYSDGCNSICLASSISARNVHVECSLLLKDGRRQCWLPTLP